jgi:hypothetical protein
MKMGTRIGLAACAALGAITPATATHSWGGYHWANGTSRTLAVRRAFVNTSATTAATWNRLFTNAMADWAGKPLSFNVTDAPPGTDPKQCRPISGQTLVCNNAYGQRGWLGIATVWASGGHISQATTKLNDSYYGMVRYNSDSWRQMVACQEVGHNWGLDHQDETFNNVNLGSCMDYTNAVDGGIVNGFNYGPSNVHANSTDTTHLTAFYNHTDGGSAASSTNFGIREVGRPNAGPPAGFNAPVGDTAAEWGVAVRNDSRGRPDVFVKDFGNGYKRVTHVFWALEARGNEAGRVQHDDGHTH